MRSPPAALEHIPESRGHIPGRELAIRSGEGRFLTIFRENEAIELNPEVLPYIVSQLQMYSLLESDIDVKGRAYEDSPHTCRRSLL